MGPMLQEKYFTKEICIHFKGMIPYAAYYIASGSLTLFKRKGQRIEIQSGEIVGLKEITKNIPFNYNIYTNPGTTLIYLDKTMLSGIEHSLKF